MYLQGSGYGAEILSLWSYLIKLPRIGRGRALQGCLGTKLDPEGHRGPDGAMRLLKEQEICRRLQQPLAVSSLGNQAGILRATGT